MHNESPTAKKQINFFRVTHNKKRVLGVTNKMKEFIIHSAQSKGLL